ncbi:MAG: HD domain-containing protein [Dehalococcoidia bacterium]
MGSAKRLGRARYRVRQFTHGLRPFLSPREIEQVRAYLSPAELTLFLAAEARDRRHSVDLFAALVEAGASDAELVAALVHDVGKGPLHTWHRIAFVMLNALAPALARRVESERGARWRQALWRLRHHARLGAERLRAAGSDARVIKLVRGHTGAPPDDDPALSRFVALDDLL